MTNADHPAVRRGKSSWAAAGHLQNPEAIERDLAAMALTIHDMDLRRAQELADRVFLGSLVPLMGAPAAAAVFASAKAETGFVVGQEVRGTGGAEPYTIKAVSPPRFGNRKQRRRAQSRK